MLIKKIANITLMLCAMSSAQAMGGKCLAPPPSASDSSATAEIPAIGTQSECGALMAPAPISSTVAAPSGQADQNSRTSASATSGPAYLEAEFVDAMAQYKQGKWAYAYGRFTALADLGHVQASRVALVMLEHGVSMHGASWAASQPQIDHWISLALQPMVALAVSGE